MLLVPPLFYRPYRGLAVCCLCHHRRLVSAIVATEQTLPSGKRIRGGVQVKDKSGLHFAGAVGF